jgi:hypothetical protein
MTQKSLGDVERLRDVLYGYHGNEGAKFLYKSWRLGYVTDEASDTSFSKRGNTPGRCSPSANGSGLRCFLRLDLSVRGRRSRPNR